MDIEGNHYQVLGIDATASRDEVEVAIERLSDQAATLVYSSPERSHDLWERVREIKADLLADPDRRSEYDGGLLSSDHLAAAAPRSPVLVIASPPPSRRRERQHKLASGFPFWGTLVGGATAAVLIALAAAATHGSQSTALTPPLALGTAGFQHGSAYVSGQKVRLHWAAVAHATLYRLQVATTSVDLKRDRVIFHHPVLTDTMRSNTYGLKVVGAQEYYWRVQARVRGNWSPFSRSRHFFVARPGIERPIARLSARGPTQTVVRKQLCWSAVKGAVGYQLLVTGIGTITSTSRCAWIMVPPGTYRWRVAALIHGARVYRGAYSRPARFTIAPKHRLAAPSHHVRTVVVAANVPHGRSATRHGRAASSRPASVALVTRPAARVRAGGAGKKPASFVARPSKPAIAALPTHHASTPSRHAPSASVHHPSRKHTPSPPPPPPAPPVVASVPRSPASAAPASHPTPVVYVSTQSAARPIPTHSVASPPVTHPVSPAIHQHPVHRRQPEHVQHTNRAPKHPASAPSHPGPAQHPTPVPHPAPAQQPTPTPHPAPSGHPTSLPAPAQSQQPGHPDHPAHPDHPKHP